MKVLRVAISALAFCAALVSTSGDRLARADIWSHTGADGVVHFTNIEPSGREKKRWKVLYKTGPGKASALRKSGVCDRCDVVPARDRRSDRYSRYDGYIQEAAALYQLPESLLRAVIHVESDYDPMVVSWAGARGLMQLMPAVVKDMRVTDVHDPRDNILGGARLLRILANKFRGDVVLTLAAYHAGASAVRRHGTIPPYENTQKYVRMVLKRYHHYRGTTGTDAVQ